MRGKYLGYRNSDDVFDDVKDIVLLVYMAIYNLPGSDSSDK